MACDLCHLSTTIAPHACVQAAISAALSPSGIVVRMRNVIFRRILAAARPPTDFFHSRGFFGSVVGLLAAWSELSRTNANYVAFLQYENINNHRHQSLPQFASRVRPNSAHGSYRNKNSLPTTILSTHTVCRAANNFPRLCCFVKRKINIGHHAPAREICRHCMQVSPVDTRFELRNENRRE